MLTVIYSKNFQAIQELGKSLKTINPDVEIASPRSHNQLSELLKQGLQFDTLYVDCSLVPAKNCSTFFRIHVQDWRKGEESDEHSNYSIYRVSKRNHPASMYVDIVVEVLEQMRNMSGEAMVYDHQSWVSVNTNPIVDQPEKYSESGKQVVHEEDGLVYENKCESLTQRQKQVLALVSQGLSNKIIAKKLNLAVGTVKVYCRDIYRILEVHNRTQAASKARWLLPGNDT